MGGSSSMPRIPRSNREKTNCEDLVIHTQLKTPVDDIDKIVAKGDILDIAIIRPDKCVALFKGVQLGSIVCIELKQLIECMEKANEYIGIVRSVNDLRCSITIKRSA